MPEVSPCEAISGVFLVAPEVHMAMSGGCSWRRTAGSGFPAPGR